MKATIKKIVTETPRVVTVVLELPEPISFKTGQCMRIESPNGKGGRLFSMANPGGEGITEVWFTVRIFPDGLVSSHLQNMTVGDTLEVKGPFGKFVFDDTEKKDIGLIAGGSGISVIRAIYQHVLQQGMKNKVHLLFSVLNRKEIIYKEELEQLAKEYENFTYMITLTEEQPEGWHGRCGLIDEQMFNEEFGDYSQAFFICGPPKFIECAENLLKEKGVSEEDIHIDRWVF